MRIRSGAAPERLGLLRSRQVKQHSVQNVFGHAYGHMQPRSCRRFYRCSTATQLEKQRTTEKGSSLHSSIACLQVIGSLPLAWMIVYIIDQHCMTSSCICTPSCQGPGICYIAVYAPYPMPQASDQQGLTWQRQSCHSKGEH